MKKLVSIAILLATLCHGTLVAQKSGVNNASKKTYELTGHISDNISGTPQSFSFTIGDGGSGPYKAIMTADTSLSTHTIYRPNNLASVKEKLPIVVWGNGACANSSSLFNNLLSEIASLGYLVVAIGPLKNAVLGENEHEEMFTDSKLLVKAIDWAIEQNSNPNSLYYNRLDPGKVAAMGQSCGGLQALEVLSDPRIKTIVAWNSAILDSPPIIPGNANQNGNNANRLSFPTPSKSDLKNLHSSVAYFVGGEADMAMPYAKDDFPRIEEVPVLLAMYDFSDKAKETGNQMYGHYPATYREPHGGDFGQVGLVWLQ